MSDQQRWFKLWCSAPSDDDLQALPPALRWAWAALGCYTKQHGNNGVIKLTESNVVLAAQMGVPVSDMKRIIAQLPHISMSNEEGKSEHGEFTVSFHNWYYYQVDNTHTERQKRARSKRREEEKRREEKREVLKDGATAPSLHNQTALKTGLSTFMEHLQRKLTKATGLAQPAAARQVFGIVIAYLKDHPAEMESLSREIDLLPAEGRSASWYVAAIRGLVNTRRHEARKRLERRQEGLGG